MSHEDVIAFGGKRGGEIMDKVMELTRAEIANEEMQKSNGGQGKASDSTRASFEAGKTDTRPHSTLRPSSAVQVSQQEISRAPS